MKGPWIRHVTRKSVIWQGAKGSPPEKSNKSHGKLTFAREFARGEITCKTAHCKGFARGLTPVKFPRGQPLLNASQIVRGAAVKTEQESSPFGKINGGCDLKRDKHIK
jgi:hypothetical protein